MKFIDYLNEAHISRFFMHLKDENMAIAIISSDRKENTKQENDENYRSLKDFTIKAKFGYVKVKGGYIENKGSKDEVKIDGEKSIILYADKNREQELKEFAITAGRLFDQDSILFIDCKGNARWIGTTLRKNVDLQYKQEMKLGDFHADNISKYYTKIGKHMFTFESLDETSDIKSNFTTIEMRTSDRLLSTLKQAINENKDFYDLWFSWRK